jgi:signal transduction histidine kinase
VSLADERARVEAQFSGLQGYLRGVLWISLIAGMAVAGASVQRLRVAEHRAAAGQEAAHAAEQSIRNLSQQLVATQEEERRRLSRELHDHLGQMLTALRLELGRIERLRVPTNQPAAEAIVESRQLVDQIIKVVRDLAMGLRPSMLDDLGLVPALEWLARDFTRRFRIPVHLEVGSRIDSLPEQYRTCVYRVVQEGLTNCARHSGASEVRVVLLNADSHLNVVIRDDGVGMDSKARSEGLGIRGMEERVRELDGWLTVQSTLGRGTTLNINLPVGGAATEGAFAIAAG